MPEIVATYDYRDEVGGLLYQVVRFEPKDFRPRRPKPSGGWEPGLGTLPRVLYRLPHIIRAPFSQPVYFVEGEKDADALAARGVLATTAAGGAGAPWLPQYAASLSGRPVVLLPDNDDAGRDYMARVAEGLRGHATVLKWVELPGLPEKGDVSDWLAAGGDAAKLADLACQAGAVAPAAGSGLVEFERLTPERVTWLWKPWLPAGKLCLLDGDPGLGKSLITLDLVARLSRRDPFPDGTPGAGTATSLLVACEDGLRDTVLPRLVGLGADLRRVRGYEGPSDANGPRPPRLPDDLPHLEAAVRSSGARLVVIDPLMAFLAKSVSSYSDQSVRSVLTPLADMASRLGCTVLFVRHLNKDAGKRAVYRGGGSIGIIAAMRSAMLVARHPENADARVLAMVKCNLGREPPSLTYRLTTSADDPDATTVRWDGASDLRADDLLALPAPSGGSARADAAAWLTEALSDGPRPAAELVAAAADAGISETTLERARADAGVASKKSGRQWLWQPGDGNAYRDRY